MHRETSKSQFENLTQGQIKKSWPGVKFSNGLFKATDTYFDWPWLEKQDDVFSFSLSLLGKKLSTINIFLKNGHFLFKARRIIISYYIHLKSQHIIVSYLRALKFCFRICRSCYCFWDIDLFFCKIIHFWRKWNYQTNTLRIITVLMSQ